MSLKRHVHNLMQEIEPQLELAEVTESEEGNAWLLVVNEDTIIDVYYDNEFKRLLFSGEIGAPLDHTRYNFYETILQYNYLWEETGGIRIALDGPSGNAVMMFDISLSDLDMVMLQTIILNFSETLTSWRKIMENDSVSDKPVNEESNSQTPTDVELMRTAIKG